ncbi:prepilin-type N-terminal cleavage/methylation domain-containing protein [bacterium]|nr:prepilin-type N-terminal cleavage/methylation domain-containing protein [bacterium]
MSKRAFTLLELAIVLSLITVISTGFVGLIRTTLRHHAQTMRNADRLQECRRAAFRIFNLGRAEARILPDQRGLTQHGQVLVIYREGSLLCQGRPLLSEGLVDFAAVRRDGRLHLLFEFENGRFEFDQPAAEER